MKGNLKFMNHWPVHPYTEIILPPKLTELLLTTCFRLALIDFCQKSLYIYIKLVDAYGKQKRKLIYH